MPTIERNERGEAVALSWSSEECRAAPDSSAKFSRCLRAGCSGIVQPQRVRRGREKRYCSDRCAKLAWEAAHPRLGTQRALDFTPPVLRVAVPPHNPPLVRKLKPATLHVLGLLTDGQRHSRRELADVGGGRYSARVGELRDAGHRILGPTRWRDSRGEIVRDTEPLGEGGLEFYRLEQR